jgi:hypothetical protein
MTYVQLLEALQKLTPDQLGCNVTIDFEQNNEFYTVNRMYITTHWMDVIDKGHPVLFVPE